LQKLGVDAVAISGDADGNAATVNGINIDLGDSGALSAGGLPVFGNTDGVAGLTVPEDNALNVTLNVGDAAQLGQVGALGANVLSNLGIDNVQINLAESSDAGTDFNQELNNLLAGTTGAVGGQTFAQEIAAVRADGLSINTIDLGGAGAAGSLTLNQAQAGELVLGGLNFATGDSITLGADLSAAGQGTHPDDKPERFAEIRR
jgi:hypothetical protein